MIAEELEYVSSTFLTPIKYLDKELFVDTNTSDESEFPVLLMNWIDGETLDKYVIKNKYDASKLFHLVRSFYDLSTWLLSQPFAHGDLKPDNIIVDNNDKLVLIDYDGMYVPKMQGQEPRENGTPNYRLPLNSKNAVFPFNKRIDDFAIIHILLSLNVYYLHPCFINKEKDFAIFDHVDFANIYITPVYSELIKSTIDTNISNLLSLFQKCILIGKIENDDWLALDYSKSDLKFVNMEESMLNLDNILLAVNLAYSSMLYKDPARNEYELNNYRYSIDRAGLALEIQDNLEMYEWPYDFDGINYSRLKANGIDKRHGKVYYLEEYALRYLFGIVYYKSFINKKNSHIFGGGEDVFIINEDDKKFQSYLDDFVKIQEDCAQKYNYLYVFDIRDFFMSVDLSDLKDIYFGNYFCNVGWLDGLFSKVLRKGSVKGLNPCSEVDFFFANLYLNKLDDVMMKFDGIEYYRYCDDIRIFANDNSLQNVLAGIIMDVLSSLSLELNYDKTKIIDTKNDAIELSKACFVWSSKLYFNDNDNNSVLLKGKSLIEIVENDLAFTYISELLKTINEQAYDSDGSLDLHLDNLFYILKNVHKNSAIRIVSELIFERGLESAQSMLVFSYILEKTVDALKDEAVEPFVKYWILRTFFCSDKQYYKHYIKEEYKWRNQYWYPNPCYVDQIANLLKTDFRKYGSDTLLSHISDYIISIIDPFNNVEDNDNVDTLPF